MASAAGVVLGAVALLPPTLSLINFWTQFIGDTRRFGEDSAKLSLKFAQLSSRYKSLQSILFDEKKFSFLQKSLYDDLSETDQTLILSMLRELPRILYEYYLIEKTYEVEYNHEKIQTDSDQPDLTLAVVLTPEEVQAMYADGQKPEIRAPSKLLSFHHMWWAARIKKRTLKLLSEYKDWLGRIKDVLEQSWWPLSFSEKYENLHNMEQDPDCKSLGVAAAAGLRKLLLKDAPLPSNVLLENAILQVEPFDGALRGLSQLRGDTVYVESLRYQPNKEGFLDETLRRRFQEISSLLNRADDPGFHVLHCQKFAEVQYPEPQFQLIFELPGGSKGSNNKPVSLKSLIDPRTSAKPSLGARFRFCNDLARSLSLFHAIGWIHRSIRSENILFFRAAGANNLDEPYICGFEACRLEEDSSTGPWDDLPERNVYRHPDRWGIPKKTFTKYHDIYGEYYTTIRSNDTNPLLTQSPALGVVFLEVGLWQTVTEIKGIDLAATIKNSEESKAPKLVYEKLLRQAKGRLGHRCGDRFRDITVMCLEGKAGELGIGVSEYDEFKTGLQRKYQDNVVKPLALLAEAVSVSAGSEHGQ